MAILSLVLAVAGAGLAFGGFVSGIDAALNGSGSGPGASIIIFFVGSAVLVAALVLAIVALVRSHAKALPIVAISVGLLPIAALIVIALANRR
jgi:ABC-type Na+ efflux pump permease subunit